jgi:hypothetical protein
MTAFLVFLSSVLTIVGFVPYLKDIIKGKTKPRVIASLTDTQYPAAILGFVVTSVCFSIVIFGWKHGDRHFDRLDIVCQIGALVGLVLSFIFNSPAFAVLAAVAIDAIGSVPTVVHSWKLPHEETWVTYLIFILSDLCTLFAVQHIQVTAIAYPLYLLILNVILTTVILSRHKHVIKSKAVQLENR